MADFKTGPREIDQFLIDKFTNNGESHYFYYFRDNANIKSSSRIFSTEEVDRAVEQALKKEPFQYYYTDEFLYQSLDDFSIKGKSVVVVGSTSCTYEAICLAYGGKPTTIDYHPVKNEHLDIETMTVEEYEQNPVQFDVAFSISTYEHTGLGRYGDLINPNGDIHAMQELKHVLKKGGILFLAVPVGPDAIVYNEHRIYGKNRLPRLLEGWDLLKSYGFSEEWFNRKLQKDVKYQPVFVLENN